MNKQVINYSLDGIAFILTGLQTEAVFQIISLILTIIATLISIFFTIVSWYNKAKKDGVISKEEYDELFKELEKLKGEKHE